MFVFLLALLVQFIAVCCDVESFEIVTGSQNENPSLINNLLPVNDDSDILWDQIALDDVAGFGTSSVIWIDTDPIQFSELADDFQIDDKCWRISTILLLRSPTNILNQESWRYSIYEDSGNGPGTLLLTGDISDNDVIKTEENPTSGNAYSVEMNLNFVINLEGNGNIYYISVQPINNNVFPFGNSFTRNLNTITLNPVYNRFSDAFNPDAECTAPVWGQSDCIARQDVDMQFSLFGSINGCCTVNPDKCSCFENGKISYIKQKYLIKKRVLSSVELCCKKCYENYKCKSWDYNGNNYECRLFRKMLRDDIIETNEDYFYGGITDDYYL